MHLRELHLVHYKKECRPTTAERQEPEEAYRDLFLELALLFTRVELVRLIDRLRRAQRDRRRRFDVELPTPSHQPMAARSRERATSGVST